MIYQMRLEFLPLDGGPSVLELPLGKEDFARAVETAFFDGLRAGSSANTCCLGTACASSRASLHAASIRHLRKASALFCRLSMAANIALTLECSS